MFEKMHNPLQPAFNFFRSSPPQAKNLLVVNKGPGAETICREDGGWDLLEIFFSPEQINAVKQTPALSHADHIIFEPDRSARKFHILKNIFMNTQLFNSYEHIMIADDDVIPIGGSIKDIFSLFAQTGCRVGQPALTPDSYFFHMITVKNNNFTWRKTNFAEMMCPIFTREALQEYVNVFDQPATGLGLDYYWSHHETCKGHGVALLDSTPVKHMRPLGSGVAYDNVLSPKEELLSFLAQHSLTRFKHYCLGGQPHNPEINIYDPAMRYELITSGYAPTLLQDWRCKAYLADETAAWVTAPQL